MSFSKIAYIQRERTFLKRYSVGRYNLSKNVLSLRGESLFQFSTILPMSVISY